MKTLATLPNESQRRAKKKSKMKKINVITTQELLSGPNRTQSKTKQK